MNSNFILQVAPGVPAGGEIAYNPGANAADRPFSPAMAIALTAATVVAFLAFWFSRQR